MVVLTVDVTCNDFVVKTSKMNVTWLIHWLLSHFSSKDNYMQHEKLIYINEENWKFQV